ncbi:hypothetical protein ACRS5S_01125 [Nocardia asiatica]|uniref:hypothetical protein n=1 Tax=Nocardia asiatica TaxID=209252 RepID=UPI0024566D30|nr:hypothetical protein [Nocardia asiatica]
MANLDLYRSSPPSLHGRTMLITRIGQQPTSDAEQGDENQQPAVRRTRRIILGQCAQAGGSHVERAS